MSTLKPLPLAFAALAVGCASAGADSTCHISVDTQKNRVPIDPRVYGVNFADPAQLRDLGATLNRYGGNSSTQYNWKLNAHNQGNDWYFESFAEGDPTPGEMVDTFIRKAKSGGAEPLVTIPMIGWVAKVGPDRAPLPSFSVAKYGAQQKTDPQHPAAGNGVLPDGKTKVTGNDPNDANVPADPAFEKGWIEHIVQTWKPADKGGLRYYLLDNEPGLWQETHRDVHPVGPTMDEMWQKSRDYAAMIKSVDPSALVLGPEEWGWNGYRWSGYDSQWAGAHQWKEFPDRDRHGGQDFIPWLMDQFAAYDRSHHQRLLDAVTVHYYPQADFGNGADPDKLLGRNRSTRSLWDPDYVDESWIKDKIDLIPRMKGWVHDHYPGTLIGITEYSWGAEGTMNGATAQADVLGIFGREGLDLATRWTTPRTGSPVYNAMKIYRNYDGKGGAFGDTSVADTAPNPDDVSSFAALRKSDGALTVMVIDKQLTGTQGISLDVAGTKVAGPVDAWQVAGNGALSHLSPAAVNGSSITATVPSPSVTLFIAKTAP